MAKLTLQLVTPQRVLLDQQDIDSISCPTSQGEITILPGHAVLVATLASGELSTKKNGQENNVHVAGGFVEVKPGNQVVILADEAEHIAELNEQKIEQAKLNAQKLLQQSNISDEEYALAAASLERSLSRLRLVRRHSHRSQHPVTSEGVLHE